MAWRAGAARPRKEPHDERLLGEGTGLPSRPAPRPAGHHRRRRRPACSAARLELQPRAGHDRCRGPRLCQDEKFRNARANPKVALVIDDVLPPWRPRCVMVRGEAEALDEAASADGEPPGPIIRIHPRQIISWGLDDKA